MTDFIQELANELHKSFNLSFPKPDELKTAVIAAADNTLKAAVAGGHRDANLTRQEIAYIVAALTVGQDRRILKQLKPKKG
ncbi:MAG: hypothetical protein BroJett011_62100 [Chloroflexota bacterium]|nr:MAG: hypothetical protein BroJett011_62100 [Chloroflexota bacterium]